MTKDVVHSRLIQLDEQFIKHRIKLLRKTDLRRARISRLRSLLSDLLRAYVTIPLNIKDGMSIFRARKHREDERNCDLKNVKADIYPQASFITHLGRANREREPIYYLGANEGIALKEVKPSPGDVITIVECKPLENARPNLVQSWYRSDGRKAWCADRQ